MADYREILDICQEIYDKCEELADVDAAGEYVESVRAKAMAIEETITKGKFATDNQARALTNMAGGLDKWLSRRRD